MNRDNLHKRAIYHRPPLPRFNPRNMSRGSDLAMSELLRGARRKRHHRRRVLAKNRGILNRRGGPIESFPPTEIFGRTFYTGPTGNF
ncbi:hypothetical protein MTP99_001367 [Tenebrio molitor]|nr:hypothetical protein MTP99_001367 [Tenebrio molitor]